MKRIILNKTIKIDCFMKIFGRNNFNLKDKYKDKTLSFITFNFAYLVVALYAGKKQYSSQTLA